MAVKENYNSIVIPHGIFEKQGGAVVLGLKEYKEFLKYEMEKEFVDEIVKDGIREEKEGKTESMGSFLKREYPKFYADYKN